MYNSYNVKGINTQMHKKTLMIDLDGVLNEYDGKFNENIIPNLRAGAAEFLNKLCSLNKYELVLFTTRPEKLASKWLKDNGINHYFKEITNIKKPASIYIDDRALKFNGDYNKTLDEIENFKVYWK